MNNVKHKVLGFTAMVLLLGLALAPACSGDGDDGEGSGGSGAGTGQTGGTTSGVGGSDTGSGGTDGVDGGDTTSTGGNSVVCTDGGCQALCGVDQHPCACSNGIDDDMDGNIDGADVECSGALDDDESSFGTGISGDNRDPFWQDCFFDGNSGAGDDKCRYHTECITGERPQEDSGCQVSVECQEKCGALAPNGCDCFGCCTITTPSGDVDVLLGSGCALDNIDDETACPRCTKTEQCGNECGTCELCPGKTELPPECETPTCDNGEQVCDDATPCPIGYYCSLGCCLFEDIVR